MSQRRGRETALDMLRSLGVILIVVIPFALFFGHTSTHDTKRIRPVDPTEALRDFARETQAPLPATPAGWVVTVATGSPGTVRIGYVVGAVPHERYLEFAGGSGAQFLEDATGKGADRGPLDIGGVTWRDYRDTQGHESLVRPVGTAFEVIGGIREDVTQQQLKELAATVR